MFGGGDNQVSGTLAGDHRVTIANSAPNYVAGGTSGSYDIKANSRYKVVVEPDASWLEDKPEEAYTLWTPRGTPRTSVKPSLSSNLRARFRIYQPISMTRPVAKIVSISKAGSTTWTVTHDGSYTFQTGNYVTIKGNRDFTNFAPITTPVAITVLSPTQFTLIGVTGTATGYGGSVIMANGGKDQPGIITQVVQSISVSATEFVTLIGSATWTGVQLGDYVNLHGCRADTTGTNLGYDGAYEVCSLSTTTLILKPIYDLFGSRVSPATPAIATTNCSGMIVLRTTLRSHDMILRTRNESKVGIDGAGTTNLAKAIPVTLVSTTSSLASNQGTAVALSATTGAGAWYIRSGVIGLPDIASAAITTTATSAAIANDLGNSFQVTIPITTVAGTNPTYDVTIQESFDGGTNWVDLYSFHRATAATQLNSPILRATGRHIRYVQTLTGTSPSFTRAITRNILPFHNAEPQKRIIDRTINVNSLDSVTPSLFAGAANNVQLVVSMGAITTAPQFQLEGSETNIATDFYPIGAPLVAVASSTVSLKVSESVTFVRVRVSTAGVGATLGYVSLKAFS